jgi:hypothetical protein
VEKQSYIYTFQIFKMSGFGFSLDLFRNESFIIIKHYF